MRLPASNGRGLGGAHRPQPLPAARAPFAGVRVCALALARAVIALAASTLVGALSLTRLNPRRFRLHPLPYVSDAGLHDPERVVLSLGLCGSAALFAPVAGAALAAQRAALARARGRPMLRLPGGAGGRRAVSAASVAAAGAAAAGVLAAALAAFASVPGWFLPHHVFAALFAVAAAAWTLSVAAFDAAVAHGAPVGPGTRAVAALGALQMGIVGVFAIVWVSVIVGKPWPMVPNKDFRFVVLALLEYVGTAAFLVVLHIVGERLRGQYIVLSLAPKAKPRPLPARPEVSV